MHYTSVFRSKKIFTRLFIKLKISKSLTRLYHPVQAKNNEKVSKDLLTQKIKGLLVIIIQ